MTLTPTDITEGAVVTNGRGRFRLVTRIRQLFESWDAYYAGTYVNTKGQMRSSPKWSVADHCDVSTLAKWSTRLATPEERAEVVLCLNPKGIE